MHKNTICLWYERTDINDFAVINVAALILWI